MAYLFNDDKSKASVVSSTQSKSFNSIASGSSTFCDITFNYPLGDFVGVRFITPTTLDGKITLCGWTVFASSNKTVLRVGIRNTSGSAVSGNMSASASFLE